MGAIFNEMVFFFGFIFQRWTMPSSYNDKLKVKLSAESNDLAEELASAALCHGCYHKWSERC